VHRRPLKDHLKNVGLNLEKLGHLNSTLQHHRRAQEKVVPEFAMLKESLPAAKVVSSPIESTIASASPSSENRSAIASLGITAKTNGATGEAYPVADFVGRCFLRVCFWFDVCTSWARKHDPPRFKAASAKAQSIQVIRPSAMMPAPIPQVRSTIATSQQAKP
jgi:hypothetical protein